MKPRDNEDKHTRWSEGAKQACNRQKLDSRIRELPVVEHIPEIPKKMSPTLACSRYSRTQRDKIDSQQRIKRSFYHQGLEPSVCPGIVEKLATCEDVGEEMQQEADDVKLNRWSRSKSEIAGNKYPTKPLNIDDAGSEDQGLEFNETQHLNYAPQKLDNFNKQATVTPPSLAISTLTLDKSDMNLFNFRKFIEDLVEDQCWLMDKIAQLKEELNIIDNKMEEVKNQGFQKGSASNVEIIKLAQCRFGARKGICSSNNCFWAVRRDLFGDNQSCELSSSPLNISEESNSVDCPDDSYDGSLNNCNKTSTVRTGRSRKQQEMSDTTSSRHQISLVSKSTSDVCSSTEYSASCVFRLVQYVFLIVLVMAQCIVQFATMNF